MPATDRLTRFSPARIMCVHFVNAVGRSIPLQHDRHSRARPFTGAALGLTGR
jgi:hypothetical protein